jgi:hypothetical protein
VDTGYIDTFIPLDSPIGLYHMAEMNYMFVSCKSKDRGGVVYALDLTNHTIEHSYYTEKMVHPTGT